ncbi:MAG: hypothetical protein N2044_00130 [Cyclobacteriaceae bacterium]|nr:hypothetical protein [Cyclobacteriaceae bacterium]MCX7636228.1 hypothetical protein [Cyclobacteriaceae bacterium]MDW8331406.1 hypothetical protein [Cyclobacteriaceae bacterium]
MNYKALLFLLIGFTSSLHAQDNLTELDKRNGFKQIKLGMPVDSIPGVKLKKTFTEKGNHPAVLYEVIHPDYQNIGEVKVQKIELKAYQGKVYEIVVITDKDPRLMKALESNLGPPAYDVRNDRYTWTGRNLSLTFRPVGKNQLELRYFSYLIHAQMKEDKKKKVQDIADDF